MSQPQSAPIEPHEIAAQAVAILGEAFDDEGPYSREMTTLAIEALGTCVAYLSTCLGPARNAAVPDTATLSTVLTALHIACRSLHTGISPTLRAIDRRLWPTGPVPAPITQVAAIRVALSAASDALQTAADRFADASCAASSAERT